MNITGSEILEEMAPLYAYSIQKWDTDANDWLDEDSKYPCKNPEHGFKIMKSLVDLTSHQFAIGSYRMAVFTRTLNRDDFWDYEVDETKEFRVRLVVEGIEV